MNIQVMRINYAIRETERTFGSSLPGICLNYLVNLHCKLILYTFKKEVLFYCWEWRKVIYAAIKISMVNVAFWIVINYMMEVKIFIFRVFSSC